MGIRGPMTVFNGDQPGQRGVDSAEAPLPVVSVVVPVYNEEAAIGEDLARIISTMQASRWPYEVIVVDDGSTDDTVNLVGMQSGVRLIRHSRNRGTGAARTTGMREARGTYVVMTDGDGTYPNQDIPRLLEALVGCDMVIGARV